MNTGVKVLIFIVVAGLILMGMTAAYWTKETVTVTVTDKERINSGESSYYLVFTDGEVFKNKDSLLYFKFNSSDIYGRLEPGNTYELTVYWFRVPFLSMYRNIVDYKLVE